MTGSAIHEIDQSADDLNATAARLRNQAARLTALARAMDVKGVATVKSAAARHLIKSMPISTASIARSPLADNRPARIGPVRPVEVPEEAENLNDNAYELVRVGGPLKRSEDEGQQALRH